MPNTQLRSHLRALLRIVGTTVLIQGLGCADPTVEDRRSQSVTNSDNSRPKTSGFLQLSDVTPKLGVVELSESELQAELLANTYLYDNVDLPEDKSTTPNPVLDCFNTGLKQAKIIGSAKSLATDYEFDLKTCFQKTDLTADSPGFSVTEAQLKIVYNLSCDQVDFSAYDSKSLYDIAQQESAAIDKACSKSSTIESLLQFKLTFTVASLIGMTIKQEVYVAEGNTNLGGCRITRTAEGLERANDCISLSRNVGIISGSDNPMIDNREVEFSTSSFKSVGIKSALGTWYDAGQFDASINNWRGTIVYKNKSTPPTYSFSNGTKTVQGALAAPDGGGLALTKDATTASTARDFLSLKANLGSLKSSTTTAVRKPK